MKIEEGKLELQYEKFLISDMLKTVHHSLRGQMVALLGYQIVEFTVIYEGAGISEEDQKKVFTHYTQIDPRSLQEGKGTGVGLAICKETIHLHEGRIGVRSKKRTASEKGGSEFFFSIDFEVIEQNLNGEA